MIFVARSVRAVVDAGDVRLKGVWKLRYGGIEGMGVLIGRSLLIILWIGTMEWSCCDWILLWWMGCVGSWYGL